MRVVATAVGYDGRGIRQPGDEFDMPDDARGSWFKPVTLPDDALKDPTPVAPKRKAAKAVTPPADEGDLA